MCFWAFGAVVGTHFVSLSVGKNKESWLEQALAEYQKRLRSTLQLEFQWVKDDQQLLTQANKSPNLIGLDPTGKMMSSEQFSDWLHQQWASRGAHLTMIIGGAEGLPPSLKSQIPLISLSKMTFTHQITRLVLAEQIYRAIEINKGSPYHK